MLAQGIIAIVQSLVLVGASSELLQRTIQYLHLD